MVQETIFESTDGMNDVCKEGLRNLLLACADTKLLLGYHYGEWTFGPPEIEAAVACCSLCQGELGHVRLLHGLLHTHYGDNPTKLVEERNAETFANISFLDNEIKDWAEFVAANYLVDLAVTSVLISMQNSSFKPLHMSLEKMIDEERYHIHHGQGWFRTLAQKNADTRAVMERSAKNALESIVEWFGPVDEDEDRTLVEAGIKTQPNAEILQNFLNSLGGLSEKLHLNPEMTRAEDGHWLFNREVKWQGWNPKTRRVRKSAPDEQILYHLKGSKNNVFKLN